MASWFKRPIFLTFFCFIPAVEDENVADFSFKSEWMKEEKSFCSCFNCLGEFSPSRLLWGQIVSHMCKYAVFSPPPSPSRSLFCLGLFFSSVFMCSCVHVLSEMSCQLDAARQKVWNQQPPYVCRFLASLLSLFLRLLIHFSTSAIQSLHVFIQ